VREVGRERVCVRERERERERERGGGAFKKRGRGRKYISSATLKTNAKFSKDTFASSECRGQKILEFEKKN